MINCRRYMRMLLLVLTMNIVNSDLRNSTLSELCPYTSFCNSNANKNVTYLEEHLVPCCTACFCSEFCWARDDCCTDVPIPPPRDLTAIRSSIECVSSSYTFMRGRREPRHLEGVLPIFMIAKCIGPAAKHPLSERCQLTVDSHVVDLIPVRSPSTGDVFRNQNCAMCYNVTDYEFFDVDIGPLNGYLKNGSGADWNVINYILKHETTVNISFFSYRPDHVHDVSHCNFTQNIKGVCSNKNHSVSDLEFHEIRKRCNNIDHDYLYVEHGTTVTHIENIMVYKNVYCFICDIYTPYTDIDLLLSDVPETCDIYKDGILGTVSSKDTLPVSSFTYLISTKTPLTENRRTCHEAEVLDPYQVRA